MHPIRTPTSRPEGVSEPYNGPQVPLELLEAVEQQHRVELAKLRMKLVHYRRLMREHGLEPPDSDEAELERMWADCRAVISTASQFVAQLGSAKELLR